MDMKHSLMYEDYRINKSIIFLSSLFKKLIDNDSEDFNLNLAYSINFNKKIKSGRTLRTHLPEDIEDKVISEINKCSIIIIKNKSYVNSSFGNSSAFGSVLFQGKRWQRGFLWK